MKPYSPTQEILLITTSSFANKQLCNSNTPNKQGQHSAAEQWEEACWDGLLNELLPELMHSSNEKLYLWQVEIRRFFLWISIGLNTPVPEKHATLDPHIFLCFRKMN